MTPRFPGPLESARFIPLLGAIGMLASPMMLVEGIRYRFGQSEMDVWTTLGSLLYVAGWMCSAVGLRMLRATGQGTGALLVFVIQMLGLSMAAFWAAQYLFGAPATHRCLTSLTPRGH